MARVLRRLAINTLAGATLRPHASFGLFLLLGTLHLGSLHSPAWVSEWVSESRSVMSNSLWPHELYSPWNSPGWNTGVGSLSLLQGIFPTQVSNPGLLHGRQILYQLSHKGSPRILECVAYPFSRESSWPRNWTGVSCIAGGFFTNWAIRKPYSPAWWTLTHCTKAISWSPSWSFLCSLPSTTPAVPSCLPWPRLPLSLWLLVHPSCRLQLSPHLDCPD